MICKFCGKTIDKETMKCVECGKPADSLEGGVGFWDLAKAPADVQPAVTLVPEKPKSSKAKTLIAAVAALLLLAGAIAATAFLLDLNAKLKEENATLAEYIEMYKKEQEAKASEAELATTAESVTTTAAPTETSAETTTTTAPTSKVYPAAPAPTTPNSTTPSDGGQTEPSAPASDSDVSDPVSPSDAPSDTDDTTNTATEE